MGEGRSFEREPWAAAEEDRGSEEPLRGTKKKNEGPTKAAPARAKPSRHLTLEKADACLKISSAESASSSPRS